MKIQHYFDTINETFSVNNRTNLAVSLLIVLWNAPVVALIVTLKTLVMWQRRVHMRAELAAREHRYLIDMNISSEAAQAEVSKPFWRR